MSTAAHVEIGRLVSAMFTNVSISSTVIASLPSQSPTHGTGEGVRVGIGSCVTVAVGTDAVGVRVTVADGIVADGIDVVVGSAVPVAVSVRVGDWVGVAVGVAVSV